MTLADRIKLKREQMKTDQIKSNEKPNENIIQANTTSKNSTMNKSGTSIQNVTFREPEANMINEITPSTSNSASKLKRVYSDNTNRSYLNKYDLRKRISY
jgi:hypothetical protein